MKYIYIMAVGTLLSVSSSAFAKVISCNAAKASPFSHNMTLTLDTTSLVMSEDFGTYKYYGQATVLTRSGINSYYLPAVPNELIDSFDKHCGSLADTSPVTIRVSSTGVTALLHHFYTINDQSGAYVCVDEPNVVPCISK